MLIDRSTDFFASGVMSSPLVLDFHGVACPVVVDELRLGVFLMYGSWYICGVRIDCRF